MSACPKCDYFGSRVTMTRRLRGGWVRRYRVCQQDECGEKWTTLEIPESAVTSGSEAAAMKEIIMRNRDD